MAVLERWRLAARRAGTHALVLVPALALGFLVYVSVHKHAVAFDLVHAYLPASHRVMHGQSPFPRATVAALSPRTAFIYPPVTAWLVAPLALLPLPLAEAAGVVLMLLSIIAILAFLGVRDWRCYAIALVWLPTYSAIQTANLDLPLAVGVAALWRYRTRPVVSGLLAALLVSLKLLLWPVVIWFIATRRYASAGIAAAGAVVLLAASWAPIGFAGLGSYPHLLETATRLERPDGYTIGALLAHGLSWPIATAVALAAGLLLLGLACRAGRAGDERRGFAYLVAAVLVLTPIVWLDYFVFLLVVLALWRPTLGRLWFLPLGFWAVPQVSNGAPWQTATALVLAAATIDFALRPPRLSRLPGRARKADGYENIAVGL